MVENYKNMNNLNLSEIFNNIKHTILYENIRGLYKYFHYLVAELSTCEKLPDIILLDLKYGSLIMNLIYYG